MKTMYVYIIASKRNGTIYSGVTNNLVRRIYEHRNELIEGFSKRYHIHMLVYYEIYENALTAIEREKKIKLDLAIGKNTNKIDRVYDKEVARRVALQYSLDKQIEIILSGNVIEIARLKEYRANVRAEVKDDIAKIEKELEDENLTD